MYKRYLTILEISQKQAYIFSINKLKNNILHSTVIAWVMSEQYFQETIADPSLFSIQKNLVYSGGGHIVLEFDTYEQAQKFTRIITTKIHQDYDGIEVFAKTIPYQEKNTIGHLLTPKDNLKELTKELEKKKSIRNSAFHQGSFGIEKIDTITLKPIRTDQKSVKELPEQEKKFEKKLSPSNYKCVYHFEDLGGEKFDSNFIAIVHIDGNAMGKRIEELYEKNADKDWETFKTIIGNFSKQIDEDFKDAYKDMVDCVTQNLDHGRLKALNLKGTHFPVRRIITAGDDICFVTEGRIGLECAAIFLKKLCPKGYAACAGVAIVHQKYPFYRAYELAELLCSNAKKFGVSIDPELGKEISAIDWHIEYGELEDSLKEIRENYKTADGKRLEMRPYIVNAPDAINRLEPLRQYQNFKELISRMNSGEIAYARGKMKELRTVLKEGETKTQYFLKFHKIEEVIPESYYDIFKEMDCSKIGTGQKIEYSIFVETYDKQKRTYLFDAVEMMDTYIDLED